MSGSTHDPVAAYYDDKTDSILSKYRAGSPRVHFHTGVLDRFDDTALSAVAEEPFAARRALTHVLHDAQEALLELVVQSFQEHGPLTGDVLDAGCGLGGAAIFIAQRLGARVTGVTIARRHVELVRAFAVQAGVGDRVRAELVDAHEVGGEARFDAIVAIESSCYFDRRRWFGTAFRLLRPGGRVHVIDCFLGDTGLQAPFDAYWRTRIGTCSEYVTAAREAGFVVTPEVRLNARTYAFWDASLAWIEADVHARAGACSGAAAAHVDDVQARAERSRQAHVLLRDAFRDERIVYAHRTFVKRGDARRT
jgi:cyclopropane fatty-acyl-phospholipid synthase-like methyltransferase